MQKQHLIGSLLSCLSYLAFTLKFRTGKGSKNILQYVQLLKACCSSNMLVIQSTLVYHQINQYMFVLFLVYVCSNSHVEALCMLMNSPIGCSLEEPDDTHTHTQTHTYILLCRFWHWL